MNVNWMDNKVLNPSANPPRTASTPGTAKRTLPETTGPQSGEGSGQMLNIGAGTGTGMGAGMGADMGIGMEAGTGTGMGTGTGADTRSLPRPNVLTQQGPPPVTDRYFVPGYLSSLIGKRIRAEFLIGNSLLVDRSGILREVGVNYFVIEEEVSRAYVMCDLYSVKFVTTPIS